MTSNPIAAPTPGQGARNALLAWAEPQDGWIRWLVGEVLAARRGLGEAGLDQGYRRLLSEKGLSEERFSSTETKSSRDPKYGDGQPFVLRRLENVEGVNALTAGQQIEFNPRMTVVFGENASGKSGYVRVLKRLANVRSAEPILGNVHGEEREPTARITFTVDEEEEVQEWHNEEGVAPFTRMAIFDSPAVAIHLETDLTYVFTPSDLSLFTLVHGSIDAIRDRAESAALEAKPRANPFLAKFQRGTDIHTAIETLGASTDLQALESMADVPAEVGDELDRLRARVDALRPELVATRLEVAKGDHRLNTSLLSICDAVEAFDFTAYEQAIQSGARADEAYQQVTNDFMDRAGVDVETPIWEAFIRAGEGVILSVDNLDYPVEHDGCIYCRQGLDDKAVEVIRTYRAWVNDESANRRDEARRAAANLAAPLKGLELDSLVERLVAKSGSSMGDQPPPVVDAAQLLLSQLTVAQEEIEKGEALTWDDIPQSVEALRPLARQALASSEEVIKALEAQEAERTEAYEKERAKLMRLEASATLATLLPDIRAFVGRAQSSDKLETVLRPIPALLRSLTETAKSASDEFLNKGFERQFELEAHSLRAPEVRLDFPGRRGQAARRKVLVPEHRLSEILSEGEQKAVALADFLAESSLRTGAAPLVFDDPVTSLDYKRLEYVVDRLFELSKLQQVIVFTHNIWFAVELLSRFEGDSASCSYFDISRSEEAIGIVTGGSHPRADTVTRLKAEINTLIREAATLTGESQVALIERSYDKIRAWCEVVVEEEILQGVTKRYQPNVQMTKLPRIRVDRLTAAIPAMNELYEKACRVMGGHSQPLETLAVRPSLDELKKDWERGLETRGHYLAD